MISKFFVSFPPLEKHTLEQRYRAMDRDKKKPTNIPKGLQPEGTEPAYIEDFYQSHINAAKTQL